jgi:hypothetical protein
VNKIKQVPRKPRRLPGEIAFDRCFFPVAALFVLNVICGIITFRQYQTFEPPTEAELAVEIPQPAWHIWLPFVFGLLLAVLWFRALVSLVRTWRDPSSRVLRFSASMLLIPFAAVTCRLLLTPFQ